MKRDLNAGTYWGVLSGMPPVKKREKEENIANGEIKLLMQLKQKPQVTPWALRSWKHPASRRNELREEAGNLVSQQGPIIVCGLSPGRGCDLQ